MNGNSRYVKSFLFGVLPVVLLLMSSCNTSRNIEQSTDVEAYASETDFLEDTTDDPNAPLETVDLSLFPEVPLPQLEPLVNGEEIAFLHTSLGIITIRFFPEHAPRAVQNFKAHAKAGYFDGVIFHTVVENAVIQSGDPDGTGLGGDSIWGEPFGIETTPSLRHIYGALSMMRGQDPVSQGSQFFIVANRELEDEAIEELESFRERQDQVIGYMEDGSPLPMAIYFPEPVIDKYLQDGGIPGLDMTYTVFGQVYDGFDVIDMIASVETSQEEEDMDRPLTDIVIERITFEYYSL